MVETRIDGELNEIRNRNQAQDERMLAQEARFERMEAMMASMSDAINRLSTIGNNQVPSDEGQNLRGDNHRDRRRGEDVRHREVHNEEMYQPPTRLSKIDFPRFNGEEVDDWIYGVEMFFQIDRTSEESKMDYEFGPSELDDPPDEWKDLKQTTTVKDFGKKYLDITYKLPHLTEEYSIKGYLNGLKEKIANPIRIQKPQSLTEAMGMAKLQERTNQKLQDAVFDSLVRRGYLANKGGPLLPTPKATSFLNRGNNNGPYNRTSTNPASSSNSTGQYNRATNTIPRKVNLDQKAYDEKKKNNQCFYCEEKWEYGHRCRAGAIAMINELFEEENQEEKLVETVDELEDGAAMTIEGSNTFDTMKVQGTVGRNNVYILIDSGSTHNFINPRVIRNTKFVTSPAVKLMVTVASGHQLVSTTKCLGLQWSAQGINFNVDARVLSILKYDIILGIEWLVTLGGIQWDFKNLIMEFSFNGELRKLHGDTSNLVSMIEGRTLGKVIRKGANVAMLSIGESEECESELYSVIISSPEADKEQKLEKLLIEFEELFREPTTLPPTRNYDHRINLKGGAGTVSLRPYRYPALQKDEMEGMIEEMLKSGVIRKSYSPFSSPVVLVKKKDKSWRLCIDYRRLNEVTIKDKFLIPLIEELIDELYGSCIYSKLDLRSGYHQVKMKEEDIYKTAFKTHESHYEFVVMPFGLTNAPSTFQRMMNEVFKTYLRKFVLVFFYDILIYSRTWEDHLKQLRLVFELLKQHHLVLKHSKCVFACLEVDYLGHVISQQGVAVDMSKISAIKIWPTPDSLKQLRGFLGLTGYYRRFVKNYGSIARPLTSLLKRGKLVWNEEADVAFEELKKAMMNLPVLKLPNFEESFVVETDASNNGMGAILMQQGHPVAYISKGLGPKLQALSAYEREMLAVLHAIKKWRSYLQFKPFIIKTDHEALKHLLEQKIKHPSQEKWLYKLLGFEFSVQYKKGKENVAADALSRINSEGTCLALSEFSSVLLKKIAKTWDEDMNLKQIVNKLQSDPQGIKSFSFINGQLRKDGGIVVGADKELKSYIISTMHNSSVGGHSGVMVTYQKLRQACYWRGMERDVREFLRNCLECQQQKWEKSRNEGFTATIGDS
ncbi:uncharacterized protein LOC124929014 [Impatiens glandulifera]|uniref:uncharacterized protein LOC124929014 n=1 Tax=Impatiens glandulifera TaxID=253017 RepID=UPI001FB0BBA4|nr:uncharacterized protein LOC124929014 [Impatiens glandulifera]